MEITAKSLGIDQMSLADRLRLVEEIWESIADSNETLHVPRSHKEELDRRIKAMADDPLAGSSWDDVKARLSSAGRE